MMFSIASVKLKEILKSESIWKKKHFQAGLLKALSVILPIVCPVLKVRDCARYLTKSIKSLDRQEIKLEKKSSRKSFRRIHL